MQFRGAGHRTYTPIVHALAAVGTVAWRGAPPDPIVVHHGTCMLWSSSNSEPVEGGWWERSGTILDSVSTL